MIDISTWSDDELQHEINAWAKGGAGARLRAEWVYRAIDEAKSRSAKHNIIAHSHL